MTIYDAKLGPNPVVIHAPGLGERWDAEGMVSALRADPRRVVGLDVESTAHGKLGPLHRDFRVRTVQLATDDTAWVLRLDDAFQRAVAEVVLADTSLRFCSHTRYDVLAVWREFGIDITDRWLDTRMLARVADPNTFYKWMKVSVDLKSLVTDRFGPELAELDRALDERFMQLWVAQGGRRNAKRQLVTEHGFTRIDPADEVFAKYAGLDAVACRRLYPDLVRESQTPAPLLAMETWLAGAAARMQMRGMTVDTERLAAIATEANAACDAAEEKLVELIELTPRQTAKLVEFFRGEGINFEDLGHPTTKSGAPSLDSDAVEVMKTYELTEKASSVVDLLLEYKVHQNEAAKTKEMAEHIAESYDGRLHPEVDPIGTITARMTAKGPNVQNFSKANPTMRATLLPDPGHVLVGADFDQVELRVAAALTGERTLIDTILAGGDLHQLTADQIGCTRQQAKVVNFLLLYGGGGKALHAQLPDLPLRECHRIVDTYWDKYPSIDTYRHRLSGSGDAVRTRTNRRLPAAINSWDGQPDTRKFLNYLIQSTSRDLLVLATYRLAETGWGDALWVPIHDELILQVPEDRVAEGMAALESAMTMELLGVPITASSIALIDEDGVSRWMTCDRAAACAEERGTAMAA